LLWAEQTQVRSTALRRIRGLLAQVASKGAEERDVPGVKGPAALPGHDEEDEKTVAAVPWGGDFRVAAEKRAVVGEENPQSLYRSANKTRRADQELLEDGGTRIP